jgi:hypothetical protein
MDEFFDVPKAGFGTTAMGACISDEAYFCAFL